MKLETIENLAIIGLMTKSGGGKTSLCVGLQKKYGNKIHIVRSKTTRDERKDDPNDIKSHMFCKEEDFDPNTAIAVYNSPKGYKSWTDLECFEKDKINIYAIDPIAFKEELDPYCVENGIMCCGVYLMVDESTRKRRYVQREKSLTGYSSEEHLSYRHVAELGNVSPVPGNGTVDSVVLQVSDMIDQMIEHLEGKKCE